MLDLHSPNTQGFLRFLLCWMVTIWLIVRMKRSIEAMPTDQR